MSFHVLFFFFKQQTEYDMRISDWSSDVCSSDLRHVLQFVFNTRLRLVLDKHRPTAQYFRIEFSLARAIAAHRIDMHAGFKHVGLKHLRVYRSEESSVGKECVRTCSSRWLPVP